MTTTRNIPTPIDPLVTSPDIMNPITSDEVARFNPEGMKQVSQTAFYQAIKQLTVLVRPSVVGGHDPHYGYISEWIYAQSLKRFGVSVCGWNPKAKFYFVTL